MELPPPGNRRVSISNPQETPHRLSTAHSATPARSSIGSPKPHALPDAHKSSIPSSVPGGSMPPKSALFLPDATAQQRRGSTVSSVRYADEQAKQVASDKEKDKEKKGKSKSKGAGLLNMLRKTLQGSQSEEMVVTSETPNLVPFGDVVGCLAVHIKSCRQFSHRFIVQQHVNLFIRICINHVTKCTKLQNLKATNNEKNLVLRFDEVKYFSVQVPRRQDDERNNIFLELMQDGGSARRPALSLGSVEAHLYEIIQKGCFTEVLQMKHRNSSICRVEVEFMFSYGTFGYGFSHQLKPLQKIIEPSMFMKIAPPPERTDPVTNVITPQRVEYPAFLSPELNVSIGAAESSHPNAVRLEKLQEKPRERLEKMKEEYKNLNTWMEKSEYLRNLITPKVASRVSEEPSLNELSEVNSSLFEDIYGSISHGFHHRKSEHISHEFVDKGDKEGRGIPVVKLVDQDYSEHTLSESVEGDIPLPPIHTLQIIEEDEAPRSSAQAAPEWDMLYEERKSVVFPPDHSLIPKRPSILRVVSSLQEAKHKKEKVPHFSDEIIVSDKPLGQENTNQKGKPPTQIKQTWERHPTDLTSSLRKVAFVQKEYTTPVFREDSREFKPKYQKLIKSGLDPFLRNINSKMPFRKKKGQGAHRSPSISSADDAEHEDQDPPYTEHSRSAGSHTSWAEDPNLATTHMVNQKSNLPPEHTTINTMIADRKITWSLDPTLNTTDTSDMKKIFTSDHPVYTITKLSDTDYKLSTDPSSNTTKASDTRLSSAPSSNTTKASDTRLSSAPSSNTAKPSDTRLSSAPSSNTTKASDTRLSSAPSSNTAKPSDTMLSSAHSSNTAKPSDTRLSSVHSSNTAKPSDTRLSSVHSSNTAKHSYTRLSSGPSSNMAKPSDTMLSSAHSSNTAKPSDTRLSSVHISNTAKPSDTRLSSVHSSNTAKPSDMRLSSVHSSNTAKASDTRLSSAPSSNTAKASDMRLSSVHSSNTAKPSDMRLSSVHSSNMAKPSDTRLSSVHSSNTAKPSDTMLSSVHSSNTAKPSDMRLSSVHSSNMAKPSDTRLSSVHSSNTEKPSDTRLSSVHSSNTEKPSDTMLSSVHSSNTAKPSDTRLSSVHSSNTAKPSDTRLSSVHSSNTEKPSDTMLSSVHSSNTAKPSDTRLSSVHSSNTAKPSDTRPSSVPSSNSSQTSVPNRLPHNASIISTKSSDIKNTLSQDPSTILTKPSDVSIVSHDSSNNAKKSSDTSTSSRVLSIISTKSLDSKNKLPGGTPTAHSDLTTNTVRTPASRDKLVRDPAVFTVYSLDVQLPNVPFPNYQKESSSPENVNIYHPLSSTKLTSDAENRRPSVALKSVFSRNLQDLSDELFPKPDAGTNTAEAVMESSFLSLSVRDRPSNGVEDKVFGKVQDIKNWLLSKDILNSQALLSPMVKSVPRDVFPEGGPGTSSDIEGVSGKPLEAAEINFPTNRKRSFKTKHLVSEVSSSSLDLDGGVFEHIIKQIFTGPLLSHLEAGMALSEAQTALQKQLLTSSERSSSSQIDNYDSNEVPLSPAKSSISRILQSFPVETLLESGMISVTELKKENQSSLLDGQTASPEDKVQNLTEQHSNVQSQTKLLSRQTTPTTQPTVTFVSGADYQEDSQRVDKQSDFLNKQQHLDPEETGLSSTLETLSSSFVGKLKDTDAVMLKSFLKNIFRALFKYNQSEKELDRLISHSAPHGAEHLEKIQGDFNKADRVDRKATLDPKLCESEVKTLKIELGKHIQHYLIERLSEVGHITKEDLPKDYGNLGQMSEKAEAKEPSPPQDRYSETIKEVVSFVKSFNHHFVDKHLETKLRSFLNEILQKCCLRNLSGSNLFNEADSMALRPSMSSLRSKSTPRCLPELEQDIASGGLGSKLKINMKYPLSESLQNCLNVIPENELLGLKTDLNKYVQVLFIEKLQKSGLIIEKQLEGISQQVNSLDSSSRSLNYTKPDLPLRGESYFMREDSEKQKKYPKVCQNPMSPTFLEDPYGEKELTREEEKGGSFSHSLKENLPAVWEHKHVYSREVKTLIKVQPHPNKNIQANPLNKSPERLADLLLKKHQKDHGFMQLPQAENSVYKAETQESYSWDGRSKQIQSKLCFEKTVRAKSLDKRESNNICKLLAQEKPDMGLPPYLKLPTSKMSRENEHLNRQPFPTWRNNTFLYVNTESGEQSKLDKYCQKWKGNNNNNKKHLVTFAQFKNEMETLYTNPYEACHEKCTKISESPPFENKEDGRDSRPSFFPEVLKRENMKSKRRDYTVKPKKSFYKLVRILPATLPTRPHLRKSVPRTLLHWTARRTIHDCLDRFDDLHMPSVKHPKNSKSRARLLGKSPDDPYNQAKHCARPFTAPNKRRESVAGKFASPRMVSAGLVHIHDTTPEYEIRKIRSKRKLKENIEKRPLICDIIQMLDSIG